MVDRELTAFRLEASTLQALRFVKERDGLPVSEQVRRAVDEWLKTHDTDIRTIHAAFENFEVSLTTGNRGGEYDGVRLPSAFGLIGGRTLGTLTSTEFESIERMATSVGRSSPWFRRCWQKATAQRSAAQRKR